MSLETGGEVAFLQRNLLKGLVSVRVGWPTGFIFHLVEEGGG